MKTYTIIRDFFEQGGKHCVLGVYLVEKGCDGWAATLELPHQTTDMAAMARVLRKYKQAPAKEPYAQSWESFGEAGGDVGEILMANNADCPLSVLQEALEAVGIHVDLIEGRGSEMSYRSTTPKWSEWPDAVPTG